MKVTTYLNYGGNCKEALHFYRDHLGGKITSMIPYSQQPSPGNTPPGMNDAVMHARITLGDAEIMASDVPADRFQPMRSVYLALGVPTSEEAERLYGILSPGAEIFMPMQETFFAFRFGMLRDKFGTSWMITHERPMPA